MIQRGDAAEIGGRGIDRDGAELERVADGIVSQKREHISRKVQHH